MKTTRKFGEDVKIIWKDRKRYFGLPLSFTCYSIVEKPGKWIKLFVEKGLFSTHIEETQVYRIDDFTVFESFVNKIFGVGNIEVYCNDASTNHFTILRVKSPYKVHEIIADCIERDRKRRNVGNSELQI